MARKLAKIYPSCEVIAPVRLLFERKKKSWETTERPLLPGYIFLYSDQVINFDRVNIDLVHPLYYQRGERELQGADYVYAEWIKRNNGRIEISEIMNVNKEVKVIRGPLFDRIGKIVKLDRHKRRATVSFSFGGTEKQVSLSVIELEHL